MQFGSNLPHLHDYFHLQKKKKRFEMTSQNNASFSLFL